MKKSSGGGVILKVLTAICKYAVGNRKCDSIPPATLANVARIRNASSRLRRWNLLNRRNVRVNASRVEIDSKVICADYHRLSVTDLNENLASRKFRVRV